MARHWLLPLFFYAPVLVLCCASSFAAATGGHVDSGFISQAPDEEWPSYGRDYHEQRFSPLAQINSDNIDQLGLAWSFDTDYNRGLEATPVVVDGVMYVTGNWSVVYALNAATGELLWRYDPEVDKAWGKMACCDVVNRGVALYEGKVFVGTIDARLIALDAASGDLLWQAQTADLSHPYTITGAPRAAKGKVFIGNGGAEYGVRGYVSAYDVDSGDLAWRFYTVPGNPADGFEDATQAMAAETWSGEWWRYGGGGTVWDAIVYDPELNQLYIGVGNGSPWNPRIRSPEGGDNLFLSSIVALDPDTGDYIWHYQETPAEAWDYTATQPIILANMEVDGESTPVIWHAPKNGFFFVIDRREGRLLSAEPFAPVNWASHYDLATGRPVLTPNADYADGPFALLPPGTGAHNWHPMAYSPDTGLVYIPVLDSPAYTLEDPAEFIYQQGHWNYGTNIHIESIGNDLMAQPLLRQFSRGHLSAWDPVLQKERWRVQHKRGWNGGVLATAGDLVFQGTGDKRFLAMRASDGAVLWQFEAQSGVMAGPASYSIDGEQYIAVLAGWGGGVGMIEGIEPGIFAARGRVLAFKLGGNSVLPALPAAVQRPEPPPVTVDDEQTITRGSELYIKYCGICHGLEGVSNGRVPDLRRLPQVFYDNFDAIVLDGAMRDAGMAGFGDVLTPEDSAAIKAYIVQQANEDWALSQQSDWYLALKRAWYQLLAWLIAAWQAIAA